ncbi:MAG: hypothetical protein ACKO1L_11930 [Brachymonas sp.]
MSLIQRAVLVGLVLCMALAQSISITHRTLHHEVRLLAYAYEEQQLEHSHSHAHGADCDHGLFSRWFAGHEQGDESCRVIDGSDSYSNAFSHFAGVFPALFAHVFIASIANSLAAWQAPLFEARGPPARSL